MADKISITICGDGGCGKSSITLRLVRSQWTHEYDPTIEDSYSVTRTIDGLPYHLSLTDTAGQEEYRSLWAASNLSSDAFLLVYDITNPASLDALQYFTDMIDIESENREENNRRILMSKHGRDNRGPRSELRTIPIRIVAGNKCDLKESRQISSREGLEWARARNCGFMETSAREMVNVEETFALIVRRVVNARREQQQQHHQPQQSSSASPYSLIPKLASMQQQYQHQQQPSLQAMNMALPASRIANSPPLRMNAQQPLSPAPDFGVTDRDRGEQRMNEKSAFDSNGGGSGSRDIDASHNGGSKPWWRRMFSCCGCL